MGLCEPNAHPLETHYDSFVGEPQTELPRFHIGKPCSKLPDQDVSGGEQTHLMHKTLNPYTTICTKIVKKSSIETST
jgi:hypothetical protein